MKPKCGYAWCDDGVEAGVVKPEALECPDSNFVADLDSLLSAAFYCAAQGAEDASKVDMFQALKRQFIENYGHL